MTECVFCRIVSGQLPSAKVFENEKIVAFLDIGPIAPGHTLIATKDHFEVLTDLPQPLLQDLFAAVYQVTPAVVKATSAEGYNLLVNNRKCAGQAVPHVHVHLIPRKENDDRKFNWRPGKYEGDEMARMQEQIRAAF
jgi:histidine triad (HIT) family protein